MAKRRGSSVPRVVPERRKATELNLRMIMPGLPIVALGCR